MGLSLIAHCNVKFVESFSNEEDYYWKYEPWRMEWGVDTVPNKEHIFVPLYLGEWHSYGKWLGSIKVGGVYKINGFTEETHMGYSRFDSFRRNLAQSAGLDFDEIKADREGKFSDKPFYFLLHHPDSDGVIGPECCQKIVNDFEEQEQYFPRTKNFRAKNSDFERTLADVFRVFRFAAEAGFVLFR